jgi:hypothetical protein
MRFESNKGQNGKKMKNKHILQFLKTYFLLSLVFGWFFGFAFQR